MKKDKQLHLSNREKYITYILYIIPGLVAYCALFVLPLILGIYYSMLDWNGFSKRFKFIGMGNYLKALKDSQFRTSLWFNVRYTVMLVACIMVLSIILALLLNKKMKGRTFVRSMFFFPAVVSMLTASLIFNEVFFRVVPMLGKVLNIGILKTSVLANPRTAIFGVLFVHVWQGCAIPTVLFMAALQTVPTDIVESSILDGCSRWQQFWKITFPFLLPVVSVVLILLLRDGLMVFDYVYGLTEGGPGGATTSITLLIYRQGFEQMKFSYAIAESLILSVIMIVLSLFQIKFINKKKVY